MGYAKSNMFERPIENMYENVGNKVLRIWSVFFPMISIDVITHVIYHIYNIHIRLISDFAKEPE